MLFTQFKKIKHLLVYSDLKVKSSHNLNDVRIFLDTDLSRNPHLNKYMTRTIAVKHSKYRKHFYGFFYS